MSATERSNQSGDAGECAICAEPYAEPRQLPCGHVYCVECLDRWVARGRWPRLTCPTCREQFQLPDGGGGVRDLPLPAAAPELDDDEDPDLGSFEIVTDFWPDDRASDEEPETSDTQADNAWVDHNVNEVVDDVINRNVNTMATYDADDVPTGGPLDNQVIMNAPAELHDNEQGNGVVEVRGMKDVEASVGAVTSLNNELYVALNDSRQIHVYDCDQLQFLRCLPVDDLGAQVYGLAACSVVGRLYVSDWENDRVRSVPLNVDDDPGDEAASWNVANQPAGLSLTAEDGPPNVLVACHGAGKIQEWSADGILIRQIQLADESRLVWHALQLSATELVVSHEGSQHRVVVVSADDGQVLRYCDQADDVQLQYPRSVAVDRALGRVLVADQCNNRIVVAEDDLTGARRLEVNLNDGLAWPYGLHLDQNRRRLYVTEWNHGRILRVDLP